MKRTAAILLGFLAFSCGGDGGGDGIPEDQSCDEVANLICNKIFTCDELMAVRTQAMTIDICKLAVRAEACTGTSVCADNQTYNGAAAKECRDTASAQSCATFAGAAFNINDPLASAPVCATVCTGP
jgi:hypothetical protein